MRMHELLWSFKGEKEKADGEGGGGMSYVEFRCTVKHGLRRTRSTRAMAMDDEIRDLV